MRIFAKGREEEEARELELACDPKMNLSMRSSPLWRRCCSVLQEDVGFGPFYAYNSLSPQPWDFSDHYEFTTILFSFTKELLQRICMKLLAKMDVATPTPPHRVTRLPEIEMHGRADEVDLTDCVDDATVSAMPRESKKQVSEMDPLSVTLLSTIMKSVVDEDDAITNLDQEDQQLQGVTAITIIENHNKRAISSRSKRGRRKRLIGSEDLEKNFSLTSEENANSSNASDREPSATVTVGRVSSLEPTMQDVELVTLKVEYEGKMIKFILSASSELIEFKETVAKRLKLEAGSFSIEYVDEDDDRILLTCSEDLWCCIGTWRSLGSRTSIRMLVNSITC